MAMITTMSIAKLSFFFNMIGVISILCIAFIIFLSLNSGVSTPFASSTTNLEKPSSSCCKYLKSAM